MDEEYECEDCYDDTRLVKKKSFGEEVGVLMTALTHVLKEIFSGSCCKPNVDKNELYLNNK